MESHRTRRARAHRALALVDEQATLGRLYNHGENTVYAVANRPWVLRLHRANYHDDARLLSELEVLTSLPTDVCVGRPIPTLAGDPLVHLDGFRASVLTRLEGRISSTRPSLARCRQLGSVIARLHTWAGDWSPSVAFARPVWDRAGLYGPDAVVGPLEDAGVDAGFAAELRCALDQALLPIADDVRFVHHDLHRGNIIWNGAQPGLIDWDDSGMGFPIVDLWIAATRLSPERREALFEGYGGLPAGWRELFPVVELALLARVVGWLHSRRDVGELAAVMDRLRPKLLEQGKAFLSAF